MKTKEEIIAALKKEMNFINGGYGVAKCGLFGSYSREEESPSSDIDLLVHFERPIGFFKFLELERYLSDKLGTKVDLVTEDALKPLMKSNVMENVVYV